MSTRNSILFLLAAALVAAPSRATHAKEKTGLLIIAHGAPMEQWNKPVLEFGAQVADDALKTGRFAAVRTAMLEFAQPDVPAMVAELEAEGCTRIVAVPLFIAPSDHTFYDVPAVLGIYTSPSILATLAEEGAKAARPKVPILLTATLAEGDTLETYVVDEVKRLSENPGEEAVVLVAHGDRNHHRPIDRMMKRLVTAACGTAGIADGDYAFIEIGQSYLSEGVGAIRDALERKPRVIVVGVYVSSSAESIHRRMTAGDRENPLEGAAVVFSDRGAISHPATRRHVLQTALAALGQEEEAK